MITLKDIKHHKYIWDTKYFNSIKIFLWAFKWDIDEVVSTNEIMYRDLSDIDSPDKRMIDKTFWGKYWIRNFFRARFRVSWLLEELYWEHDTYLMLPSILKTKNVVTIKWETILNYFIKELVKSWYISDKYYLVISPIIRSFPIGYNPASWSIWFIESDVNKITRDSYALWKPWQKKWTLSTIPDISLEEVLKYEIMQWYTNKDIWDPNRDFWYSHSLRQAANYHMLQWTRRVVIAWKKLNVVVASKWSGKSFFWAKLCAKELFKEWTWFGWRKFRQIKYFVPDLANVGSDIMTYMEWFLHDFKWKLLPNWEPIIEIQTSKFTIKNNLTWATFRMVSLYNFWKGAVWEWLSCDFFVIDEAAYIPDEFWTLFSQRALMEAQAWYIVTTISDKTPRDHWFYRLLIDWELWDELISSHRVDILERRELERLNYTKAYEEITPEISEKIDREIDKIMKLTMANLKKAGIKEYYARAYCVILDESQVFNITWNIIDPIEKKPEDYYVLAVDFWGNADPWGLVLTNITKHIVVETREMKWIHYLEQLGEAKLYRGRFKNLTIVWDATTIGKVIMQEDKDHVVDYWIQFVWQWDRSWNQKWFYVSSKKHMVDMTNLLIDKWVIKLASDLWELINQMKNFVRISWEKSLIAKYQWKGTSHDDLVDWLMMCCFVIVTILWLRELKELEDYWIEFDNQDQYEYNEANYNKKINNYSINTY